MDKFELKEKIIEAIKNLDIMWFIVEEVEDSLDYLNKYKLLNIYENIESFLIDIKNVNENYIKSLK